MIDQLVVVIGPARSGTSVTADIVEACGYPLGADVRRPRDIREYRNEYPTLHLPFPVNERSQAGHIDATLTAIKTKGIRAVKMADNWDPWMEIFSECVDDLRVLVCYRDPLEVQDSRRDCYITIPSDLLLIYHEQALCEDYLHRDLSAMEVPFYHVLARDTRLLGKIADFLESDVSVETLAACVHPEVVRYSREE